MDVVQLKTLIHVAELGSLSKASDRLHIAQPALSRQIRMLEKELGAYLFERHGRGMVITEVGREVLAHATRIMEEMESIRSSVVGGRTNFRGTVVIGTTPTVAEIITVPLVRKIRDAQPSLAVRFSSAYSGYLLDWLQRGELELAITYDPQPLHTLRIVPVMMENLLLVGPPEAGLRLDSPVRFATLAEHELVVPSARHGLRVILDNCAREVGVKLTSSVEADSFGAMIDLVRNGFGLTALPLASIWNQVENGSLCAAPLVDPVPMRKLVQVFPADRRVAPAARFVAEAFIEIAADLVERRIWAGHML
ncbi:LysR substrate-binding domain-containing protein [Pseudomonas sp. 148P]|uniref:LysR substrate-binding domain-containing protein n=1 Tax=Pseudomonas ulcerans TaxID=3115852 RepID=A0ABU7HYL1_9PSED|nr:MULTISPECIES: LysR substrate-binding domain-containing protein [unclassified Pseudomonas]MEE1925140.1 LysR substrate-binding domain-containing protein [Pseudomonas sp. 147P]MEE1936581.1 LysR substrate-binding domain-containing protein [Pseudomonas sp. 148P]